MEEGKENREALERATKEYIDADFAVYIASLSDVPKAKQRRDYALNVLKAAVFNLNA